MPRRRSCGKFAALVASPAQPNGRANSRLARARAGWNRWWAAHHTRLITINDTPHSIALGLAIGIFFGFTPLLSLKTLLSIGVAWICKSNKLAAALAVTLHDVIIPIMPAIYWWEYKMGFWVLNGYFPRRMSFGHASLRTLMKWTSFFTIGKPLLIGSLFLAGPSAVLIYFFCRWLIVRARACRPAEGAAAGETTPQL